MSRYPTCKVLKATIVRRLLDSHLKIEELNNAQLKINLFLKTLLLGQKHFWETQLTSSSGLPKALALFAPSVGLACSKR